MQSACSVYSSISEFSKPNRQSVAVREPGEEPGNKYISDFLGSGSFRHRTCIFQCVSQIFFSRSQDVMAFVGQPSAVWRPDGRGCGNCLLRAAPSKMWGNTVVSACKTFKDTGSDFGPSNLSWKWPPRTPQMLIFDSNLVNVALLSLLTTPSLRHYIIRKNQEVGILDVPFRFAVLIQTVHQSLHQPLNVLRLSQRQIC